MSAARSRTPVALRLILLGGLAAGWGCVEPNPFYQLGSIDAALTGDVSASPEATPDTLADTGSAVETPSADGAGPADFPLDAFVASEVSAGAEAGLADTAPVSRPEVAIDTSVIDTADAVQRPGLMLSKSVYNLDEEIAVSFSNGPGDAADWIGIYAESAPAPSDDSRSLLWYYTDNKGWETRSPGPGPRNGTVVFGPGSRGSSRWPLPAGRYKALFLADPHVVLAGPAYFQVR